MINIRRSLKRIVPKKRTLFPPSDGKTPDAAELNRKASRNILVVGVLGLVLILADLVISWDTGNIEIVKDNETGKIYLIRPGEEDPSGHLSLKARIKTALGRYEKDVDLTLSPYLEGEVASSEPEGKDPAASDEERVSYELRSLVSDMDSHRDKRRVILPLELPGGGSISWSLRRSSHTLLILITTMFLLVIIYQKRLLPLEKKKKREQGSILSCLPDFLHQLVLLLNAGLVLSGAFEKTVEENMRSHKEENRFFYIKMRAIYDSIMMTNGSMIAELQEFAGESGVGELMRVSTIIRDNADKGSSLTEKLERESKTLWQDRKLSIEEGGRLAETKMTLPLSIFLGVLILITVSPAMMEL